MEMDTQQATGTVNNLIPNVNPKKDDQRS